MPLYEYRCHSCGETFEMMQKFSDEPLTVHQGCGGAVERLVSAPALQFKGTGWYVTDYARGGDGAKDSGKAVQDHKSAAEGKEKKTESGASSEPASKKSDKPSTSSPATKDKKA